MIDKGYKIKQIAEELGTTYQTITSITKRMRDELTARGLDASNLFAMRADAKIFKPKMIAMIKQGTTLKELQQAFNVSNQRINATLCKLRTEARKAGDVEFLERLNFRRGKND